MANNRLPIHETKKKKETVRKNDDRENYSFTRQLLIFAGVTALYAVLMIGGVAYGSYLGGAQQMQLLANIALTFGFLYYLKVFEYPTNFSVKIYDNKTLYIVCLLIILMVLSNFHPMNNDTSENAVANIWLFVSAIFISLGEEAVFRAFGDFNFKEKTVKEETAMIVCYGAFYLYNFVYGTEQGIFAFVAALGVGSMMTGLYLRYGKLGANAVLHFILYYMVNVTKINSTWDSTMFGKAAPVVMIISAVLMGWYGIRLIKAFNAEGVLSEDELIKRRRENPTEFQKAFDDNKEKYQDKVMEKAEPKVEASREKYFAKQKVKSQKHRAKAKEKAEKQRIKDEAKAERADAMKRRKEKVKSKFKF